MKSGQNFHKTHRVDKSDAMSLRLKGKRVEMRSFQWNKGHLRLVAVGGVTVDKVIPPFLAVVLDRRGRRYANLVDKMAVRLLQVGT